MERLQQQLEFFLELDKMKSIQRQTYLADRSRKENDAEHSFHLAIMVFLLSEYANEKIDVLRTMKMVLIHDIIEIDAGDTYAYDAVANESKKQREQLAADRIFGILPEDQQAEYRALWEEFEEIKSPESKFANTLDKIQPALLNVASDGKSWKEHGVSKDQIFERNKRTGEGSQVLWEHVKSLIEEHVKNGNIKEV